MTTATPPRPYLKLTQSIHISKRSMITFLIYGEKEIQETCEYVKICTKVCEFQISVLKMNLQEQ